MNGTLAKCGPSHPVALGMTALLLLNDHVLKAAWPGAITGKLSDVAFLVVAPVVLAAVLAHARVPDQTARRSSVVAVGLFFIALQLWAPLGDTLAGLIGGRHTADLTDLLVLPALALTTLAWNKTERIPLALPVAALACVATSWIHCPDSRYPLDGGQVDPNEPLMLLWGRGTPPSDHPSLPSSVRILDDQGQPVELIFADGIRICPRGGLDAGRTYTFVVDEAQDVSANTHAIWSGHVGTTTFSTSLSSTLPPITNGRECAAAQILGEAPPCGDTGFRDSGADDVETADTADTAGG